MEQFRNAYRVLNRYNYKENYNEGVCFNNYVIDLVISGKPESKRPLEMPRRRWEDNIKMNLREVGSDPRDWVDLAEDDQWRAYVRAVMNLRVP